MFHMHFSVGILAGGRANSIEVERARRRKSGGEYGPTFKYEG